MSGGLAYYAIFALVPTLFLSVAIAAAFVGRDAATGELEEQLADVLGPEIADQLGSAVATLWQSTDASNFALFSVVLVIFSASVLFVAWRDIVDFIWEVPYQPTFETTLRSRVFAGLVPVAAGLLLTATLLFQAAMGVAEQLVDSAVLNATLRTVGTIVPFVTSIVAVTLLYRYSSRQERPPWQRALPAAVLVVVVLAIGSWGYGLYLRFVGSKSFTGAASSAFLGLVVIYYAAQILLFGIELVKVLTERDGAEAGEEAVRS